MGKSEYKKQTQILHEAAQQKDNNPTIENIRKTCNAQKELSHAYETEQSEYIQGKICQVQDAANNKKSALAWKIVNEISGRKNSNKSKLKASNDEERVKLWQTHFEDLLGKPPKPTNNSNDYCKTILHKLYIKIESFTTNEIDIAIKNIKNGKATGLDEIPSEVWKIKEFQDILLKSCNSVYSQDPIERWTEGCILPFPTKGNITITDNYRRITLTPIAAKKIYNLMILNRIRPYVDPILRKIKMGLELIDQPQDKY